MPYCPTEAGNLPAGVSYDEYSFSPAHGDRDFVVLHTDTLAPCVLIQHGNAGDQCEMWWLAGQLAADGYTAVTITSPDPLYRKHDADTLLTELEGATYEDVVDLTKVGLVGYSGSGHRLAQFLEEDSRPDCFVYIDNLKGTVEFGNPCTPDPSSGYFTANVPAMGVAAEDAPCSGPEGSVTMYSEAEGFTHWVLSGQPAAVICVAGAEHAHFGQSPDATSQARAYQCVKAWLDLWINSDGTGLRALRDVDWLSTTYESAISTPQLKWHGGGPS